ncbi:MAG: protein Mom [Deltaproteobacteria bacterium]|nr:protein Mom [Deltaproteobacteria bacterium]
MSSNPELKLDWCSYEAAKFAVEHWHYSRLCPKGPTARIGVWEGREFIGVVLFGMGACGNLGKAHGLGQFEVAELERIALRQHQAPVSRIVSIAIRMLKREMPGLRLLVSYSDPAQGHVGSIYQAMGWTYVGETARDWYLVDRTGKKWHRRCVSPTGIKRHYGRPQRCIRPDQGRKVVVPGKHKYLLPLDAEMRARIAPLAKPYPKCAGSIESDATANQAGEGGAMPTPALQSLTTGSA